MEFTVAWISLAISGILTIAVYSFLYRENFSFRIAEHILIGSFTGHTLVMALKNIKEIGTDRVIGGDVIYVVPLLLGVLFFFRYKREYAWVTRYPLAVLIGITAGVEARARFHGWIWKQLIETISSPLNNLNNIVVFLALVLTISYFTFTIKHTGAVGVAARLGRMMLLLTFGMTIAMDLVSRIGSAVARFDWLFTNIPYVTIASTLVFSIFVIYELAVKKPT